MHHTKQVCVTTCVLSLSSNYPSKISGTKNISITVVSFIDTIWLKGQLVVRILKLFTVL